MFYILFIFQKASTISMNHCAAVVVAFWSMCKKKGREKQKFRKGDREMERFREREVKSNNIIMVSIATTIMQ